ncbi:MAG: Bax inhibitor-1/YccA family protein [Syntrophaceae bacterium]|nr:Bax inhibitor-1/YccA family protein [Syntrophaceae bacterium]
MNASALRSGNPTLGETTFEKASRNQAASGVMTLQGAINKTGLLTLIVFAAALFSWTRFFANPEQGVQSVYMYSMIGAIGGFVVAIVTVFKMEWSPVTAPIYAVLEGIFLGGISAIFETQYPGIAIQAVGLTFGVMIVMLFLYSSKVIRVTENLKIGIVAATGAIAVYYLVSLVLGLFGINAPLINDNGWLGILFSLFVVGVAAFNLVLDFDFIESGVQKGAPRFMEWYSAFGLLVTLVWLYIEILRLLSKLRSRN